MAGCRHHAVYGLNPSMAPKSTRKKIPPESARAGVEDDSPVDHTVIDPSMNQTMRTRASTTPEITSQLGPKFQKYNCGWAKITSLAGLRIHQSRKKCLKAVEQGTHIDHYFLRSKSNQSSEVQQQDNPQSLQSINTPVTEEEEAV